MKGNFLKKLCFKKNFSAKFGIKAVSFFLCMLMILSTCAFAENAAPESDIKLAVDGNLIDFSDQKPILINDRTYVPVRFLAEALGAEVNWDDARKVISIKNYGIEGKDTGATHYLKLGENKFVTVQWKTYNPDDWFYSTSFYFPKDVYPVIVNNRTMLPFRYVAELLGSQVYYDPLTNTAHCVKRDFSNIKTGGDTPGLNMQTVQRFIPHTRL